MKISLIFATSRNNVIGVDNDIPWHSPTDMFLFRSITLNKTIIMGRKTFESINSKPLKDRTNIVISKTLNKVTSYSNLIIVESLTQALEVAKEINKETFIIGGKRLLEEGIRFCDKVYHTVIDVDVEITDTAVLSPFSFYFSDDSVEVSFDEYKENKFRVKSSMLFKDYLNNSSISGKLFISERIKELTF